MKKLAPFMLAFIVFASCNNANNNSNSGDKNSDSSKSAYKPTLFLNLPDSCNTPDGLTEKDGIIYLSMPNFNMPQYKPHIYKIIGNKIEPFVDLPVNTVTNHVGPMDLAFGPDGNLYINDNQYELYDKNYQSRILKVTMKDGKPVDVAPIVTGLRLANGMVWKGNDLYVTDSQWDTPQDTAKSAIFHFTVSELSGKPIHLQAGMTDKHILDTFTTIIGKDKIDNGVDGIDYDSKGNLYAGLFGDGRIFKITLNADGSAAKKEVFVPQGPIASVDGFIIDRRTDKLYVDDAKKNAIKVVDASGHVSTLWQNGDTNGKDGLLDQPAEVLLLNNKLYISNFDKPNSSEFVNKGYNAPNTESVIDLNGKK